MDLIKKELTIKNLDSIKSLDFSSLDINFVNEVISIIKCINFNEVNLEKSYIEVSNSLDNEYVCFDLYSIKKIPLNISIHKFGFDFEVSDNQSIFEMYDPNKVNINYLKKWFTTKIVNRIKTSNNYLVYTKFYNKENKKEVLFKSQSLFNFLNFNKYKEYEYDSWI